jgi:hypothetical protein
VGKKSRPNVRILGRKLGSLARFLLKSQLLTVFLVLCALGVFVGLQSRPDPRAVPWAELFSGMRVVSFRDSPSDTAARFLVDLAAGDRVFARYDVDAGRFLPPAREREYNRAITGTLYRPLQVRGHVAQGLWLDVPRNSGPSLLPEQFSELYSEALSYVKPLSIVSGVLGTLSGYSVGYRLGGWNSSLRSRKVQERVLATPNLGPVIAREAWRRVLLEPVVVSGEDDATRLAALRGTQRVYTNFFRLALRDSDGFIPREAERLERLGRVNESRAMRSFASAVRRSAIEGAALTSADFGAIESWASLVFRRGHWANDAMPDAGEERSRYLGMLAWYGVAPPAPDEDRVWVGPRLLVREGESEGFVSDELPATGVGCPIAWREALREQTSRTTAVASAWFSDHPEFTALAELAGRAAHHFAGTARDGATARAAGPGTPSAAPREPGRIRTAAATNPVTVVPPPPPADSAVLGVGHGDSMRVAPDMPVPTDSTATARDSTVELK